MRCLSILLPLFLAFCSFSYADEVHSQTETAEVVTNKDNRTEAEIPLNLEGPKKASNEGNGVFRILFSVTILGVLGAGSFFFLKKYRIPRAAKHQTQIKVLQQHYLGPKKSLAIIRVAGESILIGITDQNISMIKNLSLLDDEIPDEAPKHFAPILNTMDAEEEFAISGIKDIVSKRLKNMRSF